MEDILGGDTVVSPLSEKGWASAKIGDFLFPNEPDDFNRDHFEERDTHFSFTKEDGLGLVRVLII
jgi:hypothetical protein